MSQVRIYGASDDLIEFDGGIYDEVNILPIGGEWHGELRAGTGRLLVWARYANDGMWMLGISQVGDAIPLPDWPIMIRSAQGDESGYSVTLVIDAPDDVEMVPERAS